MGDLQNALAPIANGLVSLNLELAQFQADTLSTAGQLSYWPLVASLLVGPLLEQ